MRIDSNDILVRGNRLNTNTGFANDKNKKVEKTEEVDYRMGVQNNVKQDLISKMEFIEVAMNQKEESNQERIEELKRKIANGEYHVSAEDILKRIEGEI